MTVIVFTIIHSYGAPPPAYYEPIYQSFASLVGCGSALTNGNSLACLRDIPTAVVFNATLALLANATLASPFNRAVDGYFHDVLPSAQVRAKRLATVPLMMGAFCYFRRLLFILE